ncbi:MAG TPA: GNAT family N-acetyltransferase [Natronoarchaeum rubrum]|nr:GNAT family N-acetyltransferase [Natronoarchaeum rubrum]
MNNVRIRSARQSDASAVQSVARESWRAAYDDILDAETIERKLDEWYAVDELADSIARPDGVFLLAADGATGEDDAVVGFVQAGRAPEDDGSGPTPEDDTGDTYVLARIYVLPDRWGEGIGTRLLDQAIGAIRERGAATLRLGVFADNDAAVGFYEARGFERVREKTSELGEEYVYVREI